MLGLLPELNDQGQQHFALRAINGPKITAVDFPPRLSHAVRELELGLVEPPPLIICAQTHRLVVLNHPEQLDLFLTYKLGAFSTVPVKMVTLTPVERSENINQILSISQMSTNKLFDFLDRDAGEPPLTVDDLPEEEDDWANEPPEEDDTDER